MLADQLEFCPYSCYYQRYRQDERYYGSTYVDVGYLNISDGPCIIPVRRSRRLLSTRTTAPATNRTGISLSTLPDEILVKIVSHVVDIPDDPTYMGGLRQLVRDLFPRSVLHLNGRIRNIALAFTAASCLWLEVDASGLGHDTARLVACGIPEIFTRLLSDHKPTLRLIFSTTRQTFPPPICIFPYQYDLLLILARGSREHTESVWIRSAWYPKEHRARLDTEVNPVLERIRYMEQEHEKYVNGVKRLRAATSITKRIPSNMNERCYGEAKFVLKHAATLAHSNRIKEAAVFVLMQGYVFVHHAVVALLMSPWGRSGVRQRLVRDDWQSNREAEVYFGMMRTLHEISQLAWRAFRALQPQYDPNCIRYIAPVYREYGNVIEDTHAWLVFGLSHREIAEYHHLIAMRCVWQAMRLDLPTHHPVQIIYPRTTESVETLITRAAHHFIYARALQPSNRAYQLQVHVFSKVVRRMRWEARGPILNFLRFTDADMDRRMWCGSTTIIQQWDINSFEVLPRARVMAAKCREVFKARKLRKVFEDLCGKGDVVDWETWWRPTYAETAMMSTMLARRLRE